MGDDLATRLTRVKNSQTLQLTHHGRKSGKPYEVTIWFAVEGETIYLPTASVERQWPRNVIKRPDVTLRIADQTFAGKVEPITDAAGRAHVMDLVARKYWYARPYLWVVQALQGLGLVADRWGTFRVRLDSAAA
jgi:deazaflavin-dependent oxidoreductase (nitroreductase family)